MAHNQLLNSESGFCWSAQSSLKLPQDAPVSTPNCLDVWFCCIKDPLRALLALIPFRKDKNQLKRKKMPPKAKKSKSKLKDMVCGFCKRRPRRENGTFMSYEECYISKNCCDIAPDCCKSKRMKKLLDAEFANPCSN